MGKRQSKGQGRADGMEVPVRFPTATSCKGTHLALAKLGGQCPHPTLRAGPSPHLLKDAIVPHFVRGFVPHDQDLQGGKCRAKGLETASGLATPHMASLFI